jgi:hypothetical protein
MIIIIAGNNEQYLHWLHTYGKLYPGYQFRYCSCDYDIQGLVNINLLIYTGAYYSNPLFESDFLNDLILQYRPQIIYSNE